MSTDSLSWTGAIWRVRDGSTEAPLVTAASDAAASLISARKLDPALFRAPPSEHDLLDPYTMFGMARAVERLRQAATRREHVRVVTDYDVDGTMSSLILQAALARVATNSWLDYHIPDRFTEGYGFSVQAANKAADDGVSLIVTADIGVRDHEAVATARARGVDVLICDHHLPAGLDVPHDAIVLCPPQAACSYANPHLAACGVSFKLATALLADDPHRDAILRSMLKLAAIGTVADLVPLTTRENRAIVSLGLDALNHDRHAPGLAALLASAGVTAGQIDADVLGWQIAPRINAAGRMSHATHVVELLTTRDRAQADVLAHAIAGFNDDRRKVQQELIDRALEQVGSAPPPFVVVAGAEEDGWHRGVLGIVAARVRDITQRPTAVVSIRGEHAAGSVRSTAGLHAVHALDAASTSLVRYGGHPIAAGFTVRTNALDALRDSLCAYAETHSTRTDATAVYSYDLCLASDQLSRETLQAIDALAPFGSGHPSPVFRVNGVRLDRVRIFGKDRNHLGAQIADSQRAELVWWRGAEYAEHVGNGAIDLIVELERDTYTRNTSGVRARVIDAALHRA